VAKIHRSVWGVFIGAILVTGFIDLLVHGVSFFAGDPKWCGAEDACGREWIVAIATVAAMAGTAATAILAWAGLQHQIDAINAKAALDRISFEREKYIEFVTILSQLDKRLLRSVRACVRILNVESSIDAAAQILDEIADTTHETQCAYTSLARTAAMSGSQFPLADRLREVEAIAKSFVECGMPLAREVESYLSNPRQGNPGRMFGNIGDYRTTVAETEATILNLISGMNDYLGKLISEN
jgi:hypothetical protein